jgi:arylformamidase
MEIYDISYPIHPQMFVYPGDPSPRFLPLESPTETSPITTTWLELSSHTGTHVDAPAHLFPNKTPIDKVPLSSLVGNALVVPFNDSKNMDPDFYKNYTPLKGLILLLKTFNETTQESGTWGLTPKVIRYFIGQEIRAIGIDTLSIDGFEPTDLINHKLLLEAHIPIIEGLDLSKIRPGRYFCVCLPLKLKGLDGAPARCLLIRF